MGTLLNVSLSVLVVATAFFGSSLRADALQCLQCSSSHEDGGECYKDVKGLTYTVTGLNATYSKTCDPGKKQTMCMIERMENKVGFVSFHRDCSDGEQFSFTGQLQNHTYQRLMGLKPDNATTCMFYFQYQAFLCVSLCNTDFCNGPVPLDNDTCVAEGENATCSAPRPSLAMLPGVYGDVFHGVLSNVFLVSCFVYLSVLMLSD